MFPLAREIRTLELKDVFNDTKRDIMIDDCSLQSLDIVTSWLWKKHVLLAFTFNSYLEQLEPRMTTDSASESVMVVLA